MAKMKTDELLSTFEDMTILELKDFLDAFEEKFDVTAAAPMAMAAAPAAGGDGDAAVEEKDDFDVVLTAPGSAKIQVIKEVRTLTSLGLPRMFSRVSTRRPPRKPRRPSRPPVALSNSSNRHTSSDERALARGPFLFLSAQELICDAPSLRHGSR